MGWKETCVMEQRIRFVMACLDGLEMISDLCLAFGISRKTGYKWLRRYQGCGPLGLVDRPRAPHVCPHALARDCEATVLSVRHRHPTWGPAQSQGMA